MRGRKEKCVEEREAEERKRSDNYVEYLMKGKITKLDNVYPMSRWSIYLHRVLEHFAF